MKMAEHPGLERSATEVQGPRVSDEPSNSSGVAHCGACSIIGPERFKAADRHHGAPLAFNLRLTTEQTHTFNNPLPYLGDGKVRRGDLCVYPPRYVFAVCLKSGC